VHEVEIGDVDGDGRNEFFTTPSEPNRLDGVEQGGRIDMYKWDPASKSYVRTRSADSRTGTRRSSWLSTTREGAGRGFRGTRRRRPAGTRDHTRVGMEGRGLRTDG